MLSLRNVSKHFISLSSVIFIVSSCGVKSKSREKVIDALTESVENSNRMVNASTTDIMSSIQARLYDYPTQERAQVWLPIAQTIQRITKHTYELLEEIKLKVEKGVIKTLTNKDISIIYNNLIKYKDEILQVDPRITKDYQPFLKVFTRSIDSTRVNQEVFFNDYFTGASVTSSVSMLTKLQNNIKINEVGLVTYCHEQLGRTGGPCTFISAVAGISSSVVQPGESLEIFSGVGSFNSYPKAEVFVYGRSIPLNESAIAVCKFRAEKKPGRYYVPVKITYTDIDGRERAVHKEIEYSVVEIVKKEK